ncbi:NfeD family protein [Ornithinimicrobium sediminis]|uniref:NfeD family protein n=1 Tax=Ornithinimicrobium sediminis TaxID=2904603 RepID=UPI001E2DB2B0|nr:NfeD family protein [Ornithinimicrobium sediminis]MCE0487466.1 NfeD family protein [Ornithinimicrobium sediminis]
MDWLQETQWLWWVGAALVLGLIEIASLDLVFTMLALAAVVAAVGAALGLSFPLQVILFVLAALLSLALLRPLLLRKLKLSGPVVPTNTDANVGQSAEVLVPVTDRSGMVKLRGEQWTARTETPDVELEVGQIVRVVRIDGATAIVTAT